MIDVHVIAYRGPSRRNCGGPAVVVCTCGERSEGSNSELAGQAHDDHIVQEVRDNRAADKAGSVNVGLTA